MAWQGPSWTWSPCFLPAPLGPSSALPPASPELLWGSVLYTSCIGHLSCVTLSIYTCVSKPQYSPPHPREVGIQRLPGCIARRSLHSSPTPLPSMLCMGTLDQNYPSGFHSPSDISHYSDAPRQQNSASLYCHSETQTPRPLSSQGQPEVTLFSTLVNNRFISTVCRVWFQDPLGAPKLDTQVPYVKW